RAHPYLHSFPTRRSSDLLPEDQIVAKLKIGCRAHLMGFGQQRVVVYEHACGICREFQGATLGGVIHDVADEVDRTAESRLCRQGDRKSTRLNSSHDQISY